MEKDITSYNLNDNLDTTQEIVWSNPSLGYVEGYGKLKKKTAAHKEDGTTEIITVNKGDDVEHIKPILSKKMVEKHYNLFKNINGYNYGDKEDPAYLIFDIRIISNESPLFNNVENFLNEYSSVVSEINDRIIDIEGKGNIYSQFIDKLTTIFPLDQENTLYGNKRHYIESITGLDVLTKKIINYPEDIITFILSEDITLFVQYLSELYNNLVYSYDTQRALIPDNLLRFNMRLTVRDIRNIKDTKFENTTDKTKLDDNVSKMVYIFHDCQLDFLSSKSFGNEIINGGWGNQVSKVPAKNFVNINFKSISRITAPLNIDNSVLIDLREKDTKKLIDYKENYDPNYKSNTEYLETINTNNINNNLKYRSASDITSYNHQSFTLGDVARGFANDIISEVTEIRDVIIRKIQDETNILISQGQRFLGENLGFTLSKVNVYYDSLNEKVTRFSYMFSDFLDEKVDTVLGRERFIPPVKVGNLYDENFNSNERFGEYNENIPDGDVNPDGQYNQKFPEGDLHLDGQYNQKFPNGVVSDKGNYNQKFPNGDVNPDGQYNQKYPNGTVSEKGNYNQKYPNDDVNPDGIYNEKFPEGDLHIDGQYNQNFPDGTVSDKGNYNEKYPDGDVNPDGQYNDNIPTGNVYENIKSENKKPIGNVYNDVNDFEKNNEINKRKDLKGNVNSKNKNNQ
jgi:hypothetical protein